MAVIGNSNVLVQEIGQVLNSAGGSVDVNKPLTYFTESAKINIFSKHKPVILPVDFHSEWTTSEWWKGLNGDCGLTPKQVTLSEIPSVIDGWKNGWIYSLPVGGASSPYRLEDFIGYDSDASGLVLGFSVPNYAAKGSTTGSVSAQTTVNPINPNGGTSLNFGNFASLAGCYLGLYIKKKGSSEYYFGTSSQTVSNGANSVSVSISSTSTGTWEAYLVLATNSYSGGNISGTIYTIPNTSVKTFEIIEDWVVVSNASNAQRIGSNTFSVKLVVTNYDTSYISNNQILIHDSSNVLRQTINIDDITDMVKGTPKTINLNVTVNDSTLYNNCRMYVSLQTGKVVEEISIISYSPSPTEE